MKLSPRIQTIQHLHQTLSPKILHLLGTYQLSFSDFQKSLLKVSEKNVFLSVQSYGKESPSLDRFSVPQKSLYDILTDQLNLENLSESDHQIALELIGYIDKNGYILDYKQRTAELVSRYKIKPRKVYDILKIIQTFEPEGVGARSLSECLLIQLREKSLQSSELNHYLETIITKHLDQLNSDEFSDAADYISTQFNPKPGLSYAIPDQPMLSPSFEVNTTPFQVINLERKNGVQLSLSTDYQRQLSDPTLDDQSKEFLQHQFENAKQWMNAIHQRWKKLDQLVEFIISYQSDFVHHGTHFIKPLLQKDVAQQLGYTSSTLSRLVNAKSIQTPHGTFLLKQLCPRSYFGKSQVQFKKLIVSMFELYPNFSDEQVKQYLSSKHDIAIARRTISKYRLLLAIPPRFKRI